MFGELDPAAGGLKDSAIFILSDLLQVLLHIP
jgi:hypothetical protein